MLILLVFFLSFAIVAVRFLKGRFFVCTGEEFDALTTEQQALVTCALPFAKLTAEQQGWARGAHSGSDSEAVCKWLGASW
jgi:hypothetical protein